MPSSPHDIYIAQLAVAARVSAADDADDAFDDADAAAPPSRQIKSPRSVCTRNVCGKRAVSEIHVCKIKRRNPHAIRIR